MASWQLQDVRARFTKFLNAALKGTTYDFSLEEH